MSDPESSGWPRARVVLFDAVGTLLYPSPPVADVYHSAGQRYGSGFTCEQIRGRFAVAFDRFRVEQSSNEGIEKRRWQSIVAEVFADVPNAQQDLFQELWDHFASPAAWQLYDDVTACWSELEQLDLRLGIASNFDSRLHRLCRSIPPLDRARHVFCSSDIGFAKPRAEFFAHVQQQLGVHPREILLVGDDLAADFDGATAAGWQALLIDRQESPRNAHAVTRLTQVPQRLGEMQTG